MKKTVLVLLLIFFGFGVNAEATTFVNVDDASKIRWQMSPSGQVWFRNLNEFSSDNGEHAGCCYSYVFDTTTPGGKSMWSTILFAMAAHNSISLGFSGIGSNSTPQTLLYIGRH